MTLYIRCSRTDRHQTSTEPRATDGSDQRAVVSPRRLDLDRISLVIYPAPFEVDPETDFSATDAPFIDFDVTPAQARHLALILLEEADGTDLARTTGRLEGAISAEERWLLDEAIAIERGEPADPNELDAVIDWVVRSRNNIVLTEAVLAGELTVRIENGMPAFRARTRFPYSMN